MPEYDGKVHISTGVYWGFLVAYLGYYSTFLSFTVWVLIHTYYTQPTYQTIFNAIASTFYDRIIGPSMEKIVNELASSGVTDFITGAVLFVITALKSILRPSRMQGSLEGRGPPSKTREGRAEEIVEGRPPEAPTSGPHPPETPTSVEVPGFTDDSRRPGPPTEPGVPGLKEVEVSTSPQVHQLGNPIGVPVLRPPVPPKIRIAGLR